MLAQWFGARWPYLCIRNLKDKAMRNTDFNLDALGNYIACNSSLAALKDIIRDLDLEFEDALAL